VFDCCCMHLICLIFFIIVLDVTCVCKKSCNVCCVGK